MKNLIITIIKRIFSINRCIFSFKFKDTLKLESTIDNLFIFHLKNYLRYCFFKPNEKLEILPLFLNL